MDGEYDEGYEMKEKNQQTNTTSEDTEQREKDDNLLDNDDEDDFHDASEHYQQETSFTKPERQKWGVPKKDLLPELTTQEKAEKLQQIFNLPITDELTEKYFEKFTMYKKQIIFDGREIYYLDKEGKYKGYANNRNFVEREDFDQRVDVVREIINDALDEAEYEADREMNIEDLIETDDFFTETEEIYSNPEDNWTTKVQKLEEKHAELLVRINELETKRENGELTPEEEALLKKYEVLADRILVNFLRKGRATLKYINKQEGILGKLKRVMEWVRPRFPQIAALVAFTAGVFSIIFAVVKLTKGVAVATAKTAHGAGKTIAKILAKLGPIAAAVGSLILSTMSYLAQGMMFLVNNLWIFLVAILGWLYNEYKKR